MIGFFLSGFLLGWPAEAQPDAKRMFKKYSTRDGLLNNGIYSLALNKNGLWWISTGIGLQRFNGYDFETWDQSADTSATNKLGAQNVYEDSRGNVWVFNFSDHFVFPAYHNKFILVGIDSTKKIPNAGYYPVPILEKDGRVWCFQSNIGFFGFNMQTYKADTLVRVIFKGNQNEKITSLPFCGADETGAAWATHDFKDSSYIVRFKPSEAIKKYSLPIKKYGKLKAYMPVGDNKFLFLSTTYTALCMGDDFNNPIKILSKENIPGNFIRGLPYLKLKVYDSGSTIFPGEKGIYQYMPSTQTLQRYSTSTYPNINLTRQLMFALKEDAQGNILIARDASDGLLVYYPGKLKFDLLTAPPQYFNLVYSLAAHSSGKLFASNFQMSLNVFEKDGRWIKHIELPHIENALSPSIRAMDFIDANHLAMKSLQDKLMVLNTDDYSLRDISHLFPKRAAAEKNVFDANFIRVANNELHFTHGHYVLSLKKKGKSYLVDILDSLFEESNITGITYSQQGQLIMGTSNGVYLKENGQWKKVMGTENHSIKHVTVGEGAIWAASTTGILFIENRKTVRVFNEASGLLNQFIYGILFDEEGNAWYSCNRGLGCIQKNGTIKFFTEADGLQGDEFDTQSFWKAADGKLYFGGINGITSFYPNHVLQHEVPGKIILSGMQVNGDNYPKEGRIDDVSKIELPYHQNALTFNFTLTDFSDGLSNVYVVKMDEFDKDWVNLKNTHTIRYLLATGNYTFHVKGSSDGSSWSEEFIFPITISPAWWQTSWFKALGGLLAIGLFAFVAWSYNRQKMRTLKQQLFVQQEMQKERERISRDLHDNIGAYSTSMIASTESLEQMVKGNESKELIFYLKENARNIMATIRETIWLLNSANLTVSGFTEGFINYCTNILRNYEGIEIEFKEDIANNKKLSPAVAINLLRILQEAIQNTVKHASATKINCYIKSNDRISIAITDNGQGFDTTAARRGNGLKNMKYRAGEINYELATDSNPGSGTQITLTENI